ncbi:MAG TPA: DsbE family thiol:disulfide interchange protein [Stenotrophobium sp.]|jgi:cytochrome c biogenesis protein CcmG/thiol:disulfide interchange protein DsbE|nr:DsbE family thiol:disulfide interchange protein [Stenotrophobium sp.]
MRYAIPGVVLVGLIVLFSVGLYLNPREVPSPLIGKPAPAFSLPLLADGTTYTAQDLKGRPLLVNFFASWCVGCQVEHPLLLRLAQRDGVEIVGMDYKDTPADINDYLKRHGDPYRRVVEDAQGTAGLDWGVYGVPETFVLDAGGTIVYKQIGPMTEQVWQEKIRPLLKERG